MASGLPPSTREMLRKENASWKLRTRTSWIEFCKIWAAHIWMQPSWLGLTYITRNSNVAINTKKITNYHMAWSKQRGMLRNKVPQPQIRTGKTLKIFYEKHVQCVPKWQKINYNQISSHIRWHLLHASITLILLSTMRKLRHFTFSSQHINFINPKPIFFFFHKILINMVPYSIMLHWVVCNTDGSLVVTNLLVKPSSFKNIVNYDFSQTLCANCHWFWILIPHKLCKPPVDFFSNPSQSITEDWVMPGGGYLVYGSATTRPATITPLTYNHVQ